MPVTIRTTVTAFLVATVSMVVAAPEAAAESKPDFTVRSVKIEILPRGGPPHIFAGGDQMAMSATVKNVGDRARAGAGKLILRGDGHLHSDKVTFDVPKLKPGESEKVPFDVSSSDLSGITTYTTKACVSTRKDANRRNDCKAGPGFAVIPVKWTGRTDATWTDGASIQRFVVSDASFAYDEKASEEDDLFTYTGSGSLQATITGSLDPDCTFSGSGSAAVRSDSPSYAVLHLDEDLLSYRGIANLDVSQATYTAQSSCFGGPFGPYDQQFGTWFDTSTKPRDPIDDVLTGNQFVDPALNFSWTLTAVP